MIELPPLLPCTRTPESGWEPVTYFAHSVNARERILMARITELEKDAERYRWLASRARKETAWDRYGESAQWSICFFANDNRNELDAAIDAARNKENTNE